MNLLEEAMAYQPCIHRYQMEVFYGSDQHKASIRHFCDSPFSYRIVKFVRSPFKRAVSSYVYAVSHPEQNADLRAALGGSRNGSAFSFRQFVQYLASVDLTATNGHYRVQTHALERGLIPGSLFLVNLDYSMQSLPRLERYLGLRQTDPRQYRESPHHSRRSTRASDQIGPDHLFEFPRNQPLVPNYRSFYDTELEAAVYNLYAEDFLRYGFSTTLSRYRQPEDECAL